MNYEFVLEIYRYKENIKAIYGMDEGRVNIKNHIISMHPIFDKTNLKGSSWNSNKEKLKNWKDEKEHVKHDGNLLQFHISTLKYCIIDVCYEFTERNVIQKLVIERRLN